MGLFDGGHRQSFDLDKGVTYMEAIWNDALGIFFELEFSESLAKADTAYAQFDFQNNGDNSFFIRAGLDHQFTKYSRTTEIYPINAGA